MKNKITWKRGLFSNFDFLILNTKTIGKLHDKPFSNNAIATCNNKKYLLKNKGFLNLRTFVFKEDEKEPIGEITYDTCTIKATASIVLNNETYQWKQENAWNTKWNIYNLQNQTLLRYTSNSKGGGLDASTQNLLLILIGLYIHNYFSQITAVLLICFCTSAGTIFY